MVKKFTYDVGYGKIVNVRCRIW